MQYHLDGFTPGDPSIAPAVAPTNHSRQESPDRVDVLIVGCGPAGLTLATQLAAFPEITTRIIDHKDGPLTLGQADGVACRSMEMFEAFGFSERVLKESYWVNETVFWRPDPDDPNKIRRADRIQDVEDDLSEFPHTILSQARIHDFFLDTMERSPRRLSPDYGKRFVDLTVDPDDIGATHPVTARIENIDPDKQSQREIVHAKYLVGCDGARSAVRGSLNVEQQGDIANKIWGVADLLAVTDFPDIRLKAAIQSSGNGSVLVIPREGGYLFRLYTELGQLAPNERARDRDIGAEDIIAAAQRVFAPYTLDVKQVPWWSVYEIGQRLSDSFDDTMPGDAGTPRVFITGDACHTHSPKAGQGMNVSMADSFNLGWKLASVLLGQSPPALLNTYTQERHAVAQELIDFDREMEQLFAARASGTSEPDKPGQQQADFQNYFTKHARFTAGVETLYQPSLITGEATHQHLASGLVIGTRFHSERVIRLADAKPVHLGHILKADGRWRILIFADESDPAIPQSALAQLCEYLRQGPASPVLRATPTGQNIDAVIDVRAICQHPHRELAVEAMPSLLLPRKGSLGLVDYEKIYCADLKDGPDIFASRGIDRNRGCMVVVRPDQHIAHVLPIDAYRDLTEFFDGILLPRHTEMV